MIFIWHSLQGIRHKRDFLRYGHMGACSLAVAFRLQGNLRYDRKNLQIFDILKRTVRAIGADFCMDEILYTIKKY